MAVALENKVILITGASSGIGRVSAELFAKEKARLILAARREDKLLELVKQLQAEGTEVLPIVLDVRDELSVKKAIADLPLAWRDIDILINNAGLALALDKLVDANTDDWRRMMDTNVNGLLYVTQAVLPGMLARNVGHIVNIGSTAGHETYPRGIVYCASKYAVGAITEGLKKELLGTALRVSLVSPGMVSDTEFSQVRFHGDGEKALKVYDGIKVLLAEDVAEAILFCVTRPMHVNINEVFMMSCDQACSTMVHRQ